MRTAFLIAGAAMLAFGHSTAEAQDVSGFYSGKTMVMTVGTASGNDYDFRARLVARHIGRHIPGKPAFVIRNMPGGGGMIAANWLANVAPRDGTALLMMMQALTVSQAIGLPNIQYDVRQLNWLGNMIASPNVVNTWHTSGIRTLEDARKREVVIGASAGTYAVVYPAVLNALAGTKFKIVTGYKGGNQLNIAMERGEVEGRGANSWASWKSTKPAWVADKKLNIIVQVGLKPDPDLPDVPLLMNLAKTDFDRKVMRFLSADTAISRAVVTAPGVPAERVNALRRAFDAAMKDPAFLADAAKTKMDINPSTGEEATRIVLSLVDAEPAVRARAAQLMGVKKK